MPCIALAVFFVIVVPASFEIAEWICNRTARQAPVACPRCAYLLNGLRDDSTRCPECGRSIARDDINPTAARNGSGGLRYWLIVIGILAGSFIALMAITIAIDT